MDVRLRDVRELLTGAEREREAVPLAFGHSAKGTKKEKTGAEREREAVPLAFGHSAKGTKKEKTGAERERSDWEGPEPFQSLRTRDTVPWWFLIGHRVTLVHCVTPGPVPLHLLCRGRDLSRQFSDGI